MSVTWVRHPRPVVSFAGFKGVEPRIQNFTHHHFSSVKPSKTFSRTVRSAHSPKPSLVPGCGRYVLLKDRFKRVYSNLFTVPKPNRGFHLIPGLKSLNKEFFMESAVSVIASLTQEKYLASVDIQDAHLHIPIYRTAMWPRIFTKVLAPLLALLRTWGIQVTVPRHPSSEGLLFHSAIWKMSKVLFKYFKPSVG